MRRTCWLPPPPPPSTELEFPPLLPLPLRPPPPPPTGAPRGGECVRGAVAEDGTPRPPTNRGVCWFAVGVCMSRAGKEPTDKVLEESDRAFMPKPRLQAPNIGVTWSPLGEARRSLLMPMFSGILADSGVRTSPLTLLLLPLSFSLPPAIKAAKFEREPRASTDSAPPTPLREACAASSARWVEEGFRDGQDGEEVPWDESRSDISASSASNKGTKRPDASMTSVPATPILAALIRIPRPCRLPLKKWPKWEDVSLSSTPKP
mmetsp:Transcript_78267/g.254119  ORF Transcript_78267/g.254119 Transcript_78267/m.254119 type:complete len:262 (-) Transcript_78267:1455-2240(-)